MMGYREMKAYTIKMTYVNDSQGLRRSRKAKAESPLLCLHTDGALSLVLDSDILSQASISDDMVYPFNAPAVRP